MGSIFTLVDCHKKYLSGKLIKNRYTWIANNRNIKIPKNLTMRECTIYVSESNVLKATLEM